jgi:hypothetical protein
MISGVKTRGSWALLLAVAGLVSGCGANSTMRVVKHDQVGTAAPSGVAGSASAPGIAYNPKSGLCHGPAYRPSRISLQIPSYDPSFTGLEARGRIDLWARDVSNALPHPKNRLTASVIAPDGGVSEATRVVPRADKSVVKIRHYWWPSQFRGDTEVRGGVYTVVWTLADRRQVACSGFAVGND